MPLTTVERERISKRGDEIMFAALADPEHPPRLFCQPRRAPFFPDETGPRIETGAEEDQGEDVTSKFEVAWKETTLDGVPGYWLFTARQLVMATHALSWDRNVYVNATRGQGLPEVFEPGSTFSVWVKIPTEVIDS